MLARKHTSFSSQTLLHDFLYRVGSSKLPQGDLTNKLWSNLNNSKLHLFDKSDHWNWERIFAVPNRLWNRFYRVVIWEKCLADWKQLIDRYYYYILQYTRPVHLCCTQANTIFTITTPGYTLWTFLDSHCQTKHLHYTNMSTKKSIGAGGQRHFTAKKNRTTWSSVCMYICCKNRSHVKHAALWRLHFS